MHHQLTERRLKLLLSLCRHTQAGARVLHGDAKKPGVRLFLTVVMRHVNQLSQHGFCAKFNRTPPSGQRWPCWIRHQWQIVVKSEREDVTCSRTDGPHISCLSDEVPFCSALHSQPVFVFHIKWIQFSWCLTYLRCVWLLFSFSYFFFPPTLMKKWKRRRLTEGQTQTFKSQQAGRRQKNRSERVIKRSQQWSKQIPSGSRFKPLTLFCLVSLQNQSPIWTITESNWNVMIWCSFCLMRMMRHFQLE